MKKSKSPRSPSVLLSEVLSFDTPFGMLNPNFKLEEATEYPKLADVIGLDEYKSEVEDILLYMRQPEKFKDYGIQVPRGVLLAGPPGTGKTLLANAIKNEAKWNFIYTRWVLGSNFSGSQFEEIFVGLGAVRIKKLFAVAKQKAPCVIFIDEIDAVGGHRVMDHGYYRLTINELLTQMDGFDNTDKVLVIGTLTSRH